MPGSIQESKGMDTIFQKKKGKIFENLGKHVLNLKKGNWLHAIIECNKLLE